MLLVELSGEQTDLAAAEVAGASEALGCGPVAERDDALLLVGGEAAAGGALAGRLGLAHAVSEHWASVEATEDAVVAALAGRDLAGRTYAVRARRVGERAPGVSLSAVERRAGTALAKGGRVDLSRPEVEVRVVVARRAHVGRLLAEVDRPSFEARAVKHRPFFSPVSLHPRFARALANLARVRAGDRVLDPFCGTGGVALECARVGARVLAGDLDPRMVAGTRATLEHYGVRDAVVEERDVGEAPEFAPGVDAVVTDPPYGRASMTAREDLEALYARFFAASKAALRPGGRLATVLPEPALVALGARTLALEAEFPYKVHASLTRRFVVFRA